MIPILFEKTETAFTSNGIGRLRDCISCIVTEERNGIYECDFEYPMDGANYDLIQIGRIIGVTHDESGDVQPFDIISFEKPINGVVSFHCVHISYRQSYMTVTGSNINSLASAFTLLSNSKPSNPFTYWTDKTSTGYLGCADGTPRTVRQTLGGIEGSILDTYGGEYEWDKWTVRLWQSRGKFRDFTIRYGVNMLEYNEGYDSSGCYSSCIPYWTDGEIKVVGDKQTSGGVVPSGREQCIPLDVSEKFESQPTKAQVNSMGLSVMNSANPTIPSQNITVSFVRLQDMGEFADFQNLLQCKLCDSINVIFPDFNSSGTFKIVSTTWNVLTSKYEEMELGDLSTSLSEALGLSNDLERSSVTITPEDYITDKGTSGNWYYRKWNSGSIELWCNDTATVSCTSAFASTGAYYSGAQTYNLPTALGINSITHYFGSGAPGNQGWIMIVSASTTSVSWRAYNRTSNSSCAVTFNFYLVGTYS